MEARWSRVVSPWRVDQMLAAHRPIAVDPHINPEDMAGVEANFSVVALAVCVIVFWTELVRHGRWADHSATSSSTRRAAALPSP